MSQSEQILGHMERGLSITALQALREYGCLRLAGRIHDLRQAGHPIKSELVRDQTSRKSYARYSL
jgi:hypothetical protein